MRAASLLLVFLSLSLVHCEQIIGADFSEPSEIVASNPDNGGATPSGPKYKDADAFCTAFAAALCQTVAVEACWAGGDCASPTKAACVARMGTNKGYLNEEYADDCITNTGYLGKGGKADSKSQRQPACVKAFGAFAAEGEPCSSAYDCTNEKNSQRLYCVVSDDKSYRCQRPANLSTQGDGDPCKNLVCDSATYCDASAATPSCVKRLESGSCAGFRDVCASGYACINDTCKRTSPPATTCTADATVCTATSVCEQEDPECKTSCYKTCVLKCAVDAECGTEKFCVKGRCIDSLELKVNPPDGCEALVADPLLGAF